MVQDADQQDGEWYFKEEFLDVVVPFMKNPCLESAVVLLNHYPTFYESVFLMWCKPRP